MREISASVWQLSGFPPNVINVYLIGDVLIDVLNGMNLATSWPGLHEPPGYFTDDTAENRRSIRRLAELEPNLLCFGHGPPLYDMKAFDRFLKRRSIV